MTIDPESLLLKKVKKIIFNKPHLTLLTILILATILRFYRLPEMANFDFDQEYAANFAWATLKEYPIQLIGQEISISGQYLGPLYFYYLVPFFALSSLHPIGGVIGSVILGLISIFIYYFVASKMFGRTTGLIAAFIRAFSFAGFGADWSMTPAFSSDFMVLLTWYCFYEYWNSNLKILPWLGLIFGLYTSIHPIHFPFYLVFLVLLIIKRRLPGIKILLISLAAFILPILPFIRFEFLHSFLEIRRLWEIPTHSNATRNYLQAFEFAIRTTLSEPYRIFALDFIPKTFFSWGLLGLIIYGAAVKGFSKYFHLVALVSTFLIFTTYYTFYPGNVSEYYLLGPTTLTVLYGSALLAKLLQLKFGKLILLIMLLSIGFFNLRIVYKRWHDPSNNTLSHKDYIVKEIVKRVPENSEFYVSYIKLPGWNFGFNYLFKFYNRVPQTYEAKPPVFTIVLPKHLSGTNANISSGNIRLILPEENY